MCDCYGEPCKVCGEMADMHLEDFSTSRGEITIICGKCLNEGLDWGGGELLLKYLGQFPFTEYTYRQDELRGRPNKRIRIYSLTENAWNHREGNTPNADHNYDATRIHGRRKKKEPGVK